MIDIDLLQTVATQLMSGDDVVVNGKRLRVRRTSASRLRIVSFSMSGRE